jgi:DNA-directed RNA polymerase specialized sigma24 family protein
VQECPTASRLAFRKGTQLGRTRDPRQRRRVRVVGAVEHVNDLEIIATEHRDLLVERARASLPGEPDAAEDVIQDAFVELAEGTGVAAAEHPSLLHAALAVVRVRAYLRRRNPGRQVLSLDAIEARGRTSADPADLVENRLLLCDVWKGLTPWQRQLMAERLVGFTLEEMAARRNRPFATMSTTILRARDNARSTRAEWGLALVPWWRRITLGTRRVTHTVGDVASAVAASTQAFALCAALGTALLVSTPAPIVASASRPALTVRALATADFHVPNRPATSQRSTGRRPSTPTTSRPPGADAQPLVVGLPGSANRETPEDTQLVDAQPSPHFADDHTIVGLGSGSQCGCPVLLRSTDGGATWDAAASSPPYGRAIALPPGYPVDSRIFVSNEATGGVPDFVAPAFGKAFVPLPLPPGEIRFSAAYRAGDPRLFVAGATAVWSLDDTGVVAPVLAYPNANQASTLVTPTGDADTAVLVMAPRTTATPGTLVPTQAVTLFSCGRRTPCTAVSTLPYPNPTTMVGSPSYSSDHTLIFVSQNGLDASTDGGHSRYQVALPQEAGQLTSAALVPSRGGGPLNVWTVLQLNTSALVVHAPLGVPEWASTAANPALRQPSLIVTIAPDRLVLIAPRQGFLCTVDGGASWASRCPPL